MVFGRFLHIVKKKLTRANVQLTDPHARIWKAVRGYVERSSKENNKFEKASKDLSQEQYKKLQDENKNGTRTSYAACKKQSKSQTQCPKLNQL